MEQQCSIMSSFRVRDRVRDGFLTDKCDDNGETGKQVHIKLDPNNDYLNTKNLNRFAIIHKYLQKINHVKVQTRSWVKASSHHIVVRHLLSSGLSNILYFV
jgi:hypothetical protein